MSTLLVTGASGKFGQRVLHHLLETLQIAPERIIATTRKPEALQAFAQRGGVFASQTLTTRAACPLRLRGHSVC